MLVWRVSGKQHARAFDGGYGLLFNGRWNTIGHVVTYCATFPSLCVLEKIVHIEDPALLPELVMVSYDLPDVLAAETVLFDELPADWRRRESWTQQRGDDWFQGHAAPSLKVPSAIVPIAKSPDLNVLINHSHPEPSAVKIVATDPFVSDRAIF